MGTSSSGLLDEAKVNHIKELVGKRFQNFSEFYRLQYNVTYLGHIHQEVEPKKEGRGLFLTHRPKYDPEGVLYQGSVKFSCWDEQGKKCRERCVVLRRDFRVEIHDGMESLSRGCAAKLVLQPAGGIVFTSEEESRAYLEKSCAAILNGVKEDSSVASTSDEFAVYLHLPHTGHSCFLFQQEEERDHFLSGLKTCIRHRNLDPWCDSSHESQAYAQALRLYQQDKGCYESWEKLLGTEEQVLASQVMEEVLPWLHNQLQTKVKGKKTERIRQWLATVQATYTLVLEQLTGALEVQREECRQRASASQTLIRSNLDQIISSQDFLEQKVRACICEEAEEVCSESIVPYMSSILEVLTEHIGAGIIGMQHTLKTQMNSSFSLTNGGTDDTQKVLSGLRSVSLDQNYRQVENLAEKLDDLKQRFGLSSTQRLVHSAQLEMELLLDSAVYTLEQFLQSSTRLQPLQVSVKMEKAKERVLKQLDHDSRVVQRKLYLEALLEITLPSLMRKMDTKWKTELQQFEQYIFSDYSDLILVQNVYDDVLRSILRKEIETVVQDAASNESNNLLLDTSDLAISQYSLLGQTPPLSAPDSPAARPRPSSSSSSVVSGGNPDAAAVVEEQSKTPDVSPQKDKEDMEPEPSQTSELSSVLQSPVIVVTQQFEDPETREEENAAHSAATDSTAAEPHGAAAAAAAAAAQEVDTTDSQPDPGSKSTEPGSKTLDSADPGSKTPDSADPGSESTDPVHKTLDSADPGSKTPDSADPGSESTDPVHKTLDSADPGFKTPDSADPGSESTDPGSKTLDSADPGSKTLDSADPVPKTPDSADPGSESTDTVPKTPDSADPGSTTPDSADPGSTTPVSIDPGPQTPDSADPGSTTPVSIDPGPQTPDSADPGPKIPDSADPRPKTPDSADPGPKTPDSADPGPQTPDSADPGPQTPDSADPGLQTPDSTDPGPKTPDSADPGPNIPDSADPGPNIPDSADPGPQTPDSADPGPQTPDSADPGPQTPDSADPGLQTPDSADPGPNIPDSADPGPKIPDSADPGSTTLDSTDLGSITPDSADPGPKIPDSADQGPTTLDSADQGPTTLDSADPGPTTPDSADPGPTTPDSADPGPTTPDCAGPGSTSPHSTDPGSTTPVSIDPGPQTPVSTDPGPQTPVSTDPGPKTPVSTDPGPKTPVSTDLGPKTPDSIDPRSKTPDSIDPGLLVLVGSNSEAECSQSDYTGCENTATADLLTSDQILENPPSPTHSLRTDCPIKICLGSLSEAIAPCSTEPARLQVQQNTDRAVYLTGQIKDNWERTMEGNQKEAAEKEETKESREEDEVQTHESAVESCTSCSSPGESAFISTTEPRASEERLDDQTAAELDGEMQKEEVEAAEETKKDPESEVLHHPESGEELLLDSVAVIRELVTEITEVEIMITPCSASTPP